MSDPLRNFTAASEADRNAKIEQLLLAGLDHYFAAQYDHAISIWTRVLFLDRSHPRARAYIERARSALAERQRESEELLQSGVAAFKRGDAAEARRLVQAAIVGGAPTDEALAVLDRLNRLEPVPAVNPPLPSRRLRRGASPRETRAAAAWSGLTISLLFALALAAAGVYSAVVWGPLDWRTLVSPSAPGTQVGPRAVAAHIQGLAVPRRGELALARARALAGGGHLRDALAALDLVRPTDPQKAEADQLRGEIQRQLIALTSVPSVPAQPGTGAGDRIAQ